MQNYIHNEISNKKSIASLSLFLKRFIWVALCLFVVLFYLYLLPYSEFTPDDGAWILDAWLRLKENAWFTPWLLTSQSLPNSPMVSWLFALSLALYPGLLSVQIFLIIVHIATIFLIYRIGKYYQLQTQGVLTALFVFLLPGLALNYQLKLCSRPKFIMDLRKSTAATSAIQNGSGKSKMVGQPWSRYLKNF